MSTFRAKQIIAKSITIPTLPGVVERVSALMDDPNTGTREIGALVAQDPPTAARVLKIANSAYYGLRERCVSTEQASTVLGLRVLRNVVMQAAVMSKFDHLRDKGFDLEGLWRHSVLTGHVAERLARASGRDLGLKPEEFYTCGLLHDLGEVLMLESMDREYVEIVQRAERESLPLHVCEQREHGFDHADVGSMIAVNWGLPSAVASAIQYHHGPREAIERDPVASLVAHANLLVERVAAGNVSAAASVLDAETAALLDVNPAAITSLVEYVEKALATVEQ